MIIELMVGFFVGFFAGMLYEQGKIARQVSTPGGLRQFLLTTAPWQLNKTMPTVETRAVAIESRGGTFLKLLIMFIIIAMVLLSSGVLGR